MQVFRVRGAASALAGAALASLLLAGCATRVTRPVVAQDQGPPAPIPFAPDRVLRLLEWSFDHKGIQQLAEMFSGDFQHVSSAADSAGAAFRGTPWTREDELLEAARLFSAARAIDFEFDHNFVVLPDPRTASSDPIGRWHRTIRTQHRLSVWFRDGGRRTDYRLDEFFFVRGDSAQIPDDLKASGFGPDSTRWYIQRWDEEPNPGP